MLVHRYPHDRHHSKRYRPPLPQHLGCQFRSASCHRNGPRHAIGYPRRGWKSLPYSTPEDRGLRLTIPAVTEWLNSCTRCRRNSRLQTDQWADALPLILLTLRATVKEDLYYSSAELVFGEDLHLPRQILLTALEGFEQTKEAAKDSCKTLSHLAAELFIRSPMSKENRFSVPEVFSNSLKNCKDSETLS
ncbi:hypothetical protein Pmani_018112 [Petrolisthes manimaculis]|uniref:Uncharacterized protein n=1 Tax=Petrolisthes manimaculis TaxID=1843537 RepID=A0AAE1U4S7_9EUCA|nr:hypothetical protein Pmani_018112 [Petrolisthes manimaculis]